MSADAIDVLSLVHINLRRALGAGPMNGESSGLFASVPLLPALGVAAALVVVLSLVVVFVRHLGGKSRGALKSSIFKKAEEAATEEDVRPRVLILFGTQTGTAERFSKQLKSELAVRYGDGNRYEVLDMEEYKPENLHKEKVVFFMMATYGDGEPTDNAADFYNWLTKTASEADKGIGSAGLLEVLLPSFALPLMCVKAIYQSQACKPLDSFPPYFKTALASWMRSQGFVMYLKSQGCRIAIAPFC